MFLPFFQKKEIANMKHLKLYEQFLNEDGYGRDYFVKKKEGKILKYFFKVEGEEKTLGFLLEIGKLSRKVNVEGAENSYCVLSIEPMNENIMDDYLVNDSDYKSREDDTFKLTKSEFMRLYKIVGECIKDYLQNNPKVSMIYDELTLNLEKDFEDYTSDIKNLISGWSYGRWSVQEGPTSNILVYSKRDHD
jgi:hypothetical protein